MKRLPLVVSFLLFIAICVSVAYWGMQLFAPESRPVAAPPPPANAATRLDTASGLFGGRTAPVAVATNFQLKGVIASGRQADSVAIIGVNGKPPQAYRLNAQVQPGITIKEIHKQYVLLSGADGTKRVELPAEAKGQPGAGLARPSPRTPAAPVPAAPPARAPAAQPAPAQQAPVQMAPQQPTIVTHPDQNKSGGLEAQPTPPDGEVADDTSGTQENPAEPPAPAEMQANPPRR